MSFRYLGSSSQILLRSRVTVSLNVVLSPIAKRTHLNHEEGLPTLILNHFRLGHSGFNPLCLDD